MESLLSECQLVVEQAATDAIEAQRKEAVAKSTMKLLVDRTVTVAVAQACKAVADHDDDETDDATDSFGEFDDDEDEQTSREASEQNVNRASSASSGANDGKRFAFNMPRRATIG